MPSAAACVIVRERSSAAGVGGCGGRPLRMRPARPRRTAMTKECLSVCVMLLLLLSRERERRSANGEDAMSCMHAVGAAVPSRNSTATGSSLRSFPLSFSRRVGRCDEERDNSTGKFQGTRRWPCLSLVQITRSWGKPREVVGLLAVSNICDTHLLL